MTIPTSPVPSGGSTTSRLRQPLSAAYGRFGVEFEIFSSSSFMSTPTSANSGVERYRSPVSGSMHSTVEPGAAVLQTSSAPAKVAPAVIPTKMPSFCASSRLHFMASGPAIVMMRLITPMSTASPVIFGMKSGLQPCIGCGLNAALGLAGDPSGLRSCVEPLESIGASLGSQTMIFVSGRSFASTRATPFSVPPVPNPVTQ